ncbi:hypothetical protein BTVI_01184 [Pitangus sulphuratus]|nr:hypothetical protein BTVI_01184 [Pitangus sulphuratus]
MDPCISGQGTSRSAENNLKSAQEDIVIDIITLRPRALERLQEQEEDEDEEEGVPKHPQTQFPKGVVWAEPGQWPDGDWVKIIIKIVNTCIWGRTVEDSGNPGAH